MNKNELKNIVEELENFTQEKINKLQALKNIINTNISEEISLDLFSKMIYTQAIEDIQISNNLLNMLGVKPEKKEEKTDEKIPTSNEVEIRKINKTKQDIEDENIKEDIEEDLNKKTNEIKEDLDQFEKDKKTTNKNIANDLISKINNLKK